MHIIIKPLNKEYKIIELGVTSIESVLYPPSIMQEDKLKMSLYGDMGHTVGQIIQTTATGGVAKGSIINDMYIDKFKWIESGVMIEGEKNTPMDGSNASKISCFYNNLKAGSFIKYGERYKDIYAHETPLISYVECGKYLVIVKSGGYDMGGVINGIDALYDNKYYSKYYKDGENNNLGQIYQNSDKLCQIANDVEGNQVFPYEAPEYSIEDLLISDLGEKIQWLFYPVMSNYKNSEEMYFQYNIIVKNAATTKNIMPNMQEIRIRLNMEIAQKLFKSCIVSYFSILSNVSNEINKYRSLDSKGAHEMIMSIVKSGSSIEPATSVALNIIKKYHVGGNILPSKTYTVSDIVDMM